MTSNFADLLRARLSEARLNTTAEEAAHLEIHYQLLLKWNKTLNLTRVTEQEEAIRRHYCESIFAADYVSRLPGVRRGSVIVDAGSGAGFPGLPLAICHPEFRVLLVESHKRKAAFLAEASRNLPNVRVLARRLDQLETPCDVIVSRAVAWPTLRETAQRLSGAVVLLLSEKDAIEIESADPSFRWISQQRLPWGAGVLAVGISRS